jgi:hypothetical protein
VAFARRSDPIPSRTRPSNASAPMVLCLKTRESRSSPGLQSADYRKSPSANDNQPIRRSPRAPSRTFLFITLKIAAARGGPHISSRSREAGILKEQAALQPLSPSDLKAAAVAGWSSPVARQAHNLKAAGSNPAPATNLPTRKNPPKAGRPHQRGRLAALTWNSASVRHKIASQNWPSLDERACC